MACIKKTTAFLVLMISVFASFCKIQVYGCYSDDHCSFYSYCCERSSQSNVCRQSCVGLSCDSDGGCAPGESCCENNCKSGDCHEDLYTVAIIVTVVLVISLLFSIGGCIFRCYYLPRRRRARTVGDVIAVQPSNTGVAMHPTQQQPYYTQHGQPVHYNHHQPYPKQPLPYQPPLQVPTPAATEMPPTY